MHSLLPCWVNIWSGSILMVNVLRAATLSARSWASTQNVRFEKGPLFRKLLEMRSDGFRNHLIFANLVAIVCPSFICSLFSPAMVENTHWATWLHISFPYPSSCLCVWREIKSKRETVGNNTNCLTRLMSVRFHQFAMPYRIFVRLKN